jgi:hypothetical protein
MIDISARLFRRLRRVSPQCESRRTSGEVFEHVRAVRGFQLPGAYWQSANDVAIARTGRKPRPCPREQSPYNWKALEPQRGTCVEVHPALGHRQTASVVEVHGFYRAHSRSVAATPGLWTKLPKTSPSASQMESVFIRFDASNRGANRDLHDRTVRS